MDITIYPGKLRGTVTAIPSKSQAHRLLICAAFADAPTTLVCPQTNEDIEATARCLNALGADIQHTEEGYQVNPVKGLANCAILDCGESGSTLRFLLPVVCALGVSATFHLHGRLPYRPLSPLWEELERMGCTLTRPTEDTIQTSGKLKPGHFTIAGNVSSQFISGLLFATALMEGASTIEISGTLESKPYVDMTVGALRRFGVRAEGFSICGSYPFHSPTAISVEGDWSNGAFFVVANALGSKIQIKNLCADSPQGDKVITELVNKDRAEELSVADFPDLVPILAVYYGAKGGATFNDIARLRLKESDRVATVIDMLQQLGASASATENTLTICPGNYRGCTIDAAGDHRIAMAAAVAATVATGPVTIRGAECVNKSYPAFWQVYKELGGQHEQYLR